MDSWSIDAYDDLFQRRLKKYAKKHTTETVAALNNLDTCHKALNEGVKPAQLQAGFIHREPRGVIAVDQRCGKSHLHQMRLYFYPCQDTHTVHLITMGDKGTQKRRDVPDCEKFVSNLKKRAEK